MVELMKFLEKSRTTPERFSFACAARRAGRALDLIREEKIDPAPFAAHLAPILTLNHGMGHVVGCEVSNAAFSEALDLVIEMGLTAIAGQSYGESGQDEKKWTRR